MSFSPGRVDDILHRLSSTGLAPNEGQSVLSNSSPSVSTPRHLSTSSGATDSDRQQFEQIESARAIWERDNGLPSYKPVLQSRGVLLQKNMSTRETINQKVGSVRVNVAHTTVSHKKHYSSTPISKLSRGVQNWLFDHWDSDSLPPPYPVTLKDMFARKVHKAGILSSFWKPYSDEKLGAISSVSYDRKTLYVVLCLQAPK